MNNDTDTPRPTRVEQFVALSLYAIVALMLIQLVIRPLIFPLLQMTWDFIVLQIL